MQIKVLFLLLFLQLRAVPYGLAVRIPGFHPGGPGSTPAMGISNFFPKQHDRIIYSEIERTQWYLKESWNSSKFSLNFVASFKYWLVEYLKVSEMEIQSYFTYLTTWKVGKIFKQLLLNFLLRRNRNSLRSFRNRVVEKQDFTLIDSTYLAWVTDKNIVCTLKKCVPIPGVEPGPPGWKPGILTARPYGISRKET